MSELSLTIDSCLAWAKNHVPLSKQSRMITDLYRLNKNVKNARALIRKLDPKNFMFLDIDIYYTHIEMIKDIADNKGITWKDEVEHTLWIDKTEFSVHEWLKYYMNQSLFNKAKIAELPIDICKQMLSQLKKWYLTDAEVHACCIIEYIDQIHMLLMRAGSPEIMVIFNGLVAAYEGSNVEDCARCIVKGRKGKRVAKYGR
mgnify:CR=1 FL=1